MGRYYPGNVFFPSKKKGERSLEIISYALFFLFLKIYFGSPVFVVKNRTFYQVLSAVEKIVNFIEDTSMVEVFSPKVSPRIACIDSTTTRFVAKENDNNGLNISLDQPI